jgi:hypothetical protein
MDAIRAVRRPSTGALRRDPSAFDVVFAVD